LGHLPIKEGKTGKNFSSEKKRGGWGGGEIPICLKEGLFELIERQTSILLVERSTKD